MDRLPFSPLGTTATMLYLFAYLLFNLVNVQKGLSTEWSSVQPEEVQLAARMLAGAEDFAPGPVGEAGIISSQALAWGVVVGSADSKAIFTQLLKEHRPGARLWGLAGLRLVDQGAYEIAAANLRHSTESLSFVYGCIPWRTTIGSVVVALDTPQFLGGLVTHRIPESAWRLLAPAGNSSNGPSDRGQS